MYQVHFVDDALMPASHSWMMVFREEGGADCFLKRSAISEAVLTQAWKASVEQHRRRREAEELREFRPFLDERSGRL